MGRFTQVDPFDGALSVPSSLNGYGYGHGNPTRYMDPDGLCGPLCWFAIIAVGATVLGGGMYVHQVRNNIQSGMDPWQAMYYKNIDWPKVGGAAAIGAVVAPAIYLGYLCLMSGGWCLAAWEIIDYYDDMATLAAAAEGDPQAAAQASAMQALQLWPDLPINFLLSKADDIAGAAKVARHADDVSVLSSDMALLRRASNNLSDSGDILLSKGMPSGARWKVTSDGIVYGDANTSYLRPWKTNPEGIKYTYLENTGEGYFADELPEFLKFFPDGPPPGEYGFDIPRALDPGEMSVLSYSYNKVEFSLYFNADPHGVFPRGRFKLYSGDRTSVRAITDPNWREIYHVHPSPSTIPSKADIRVRWLATQPRFGYSFGSPQMSARIIGINSNTRMYTIGRYWILGD